jgi:hypothetical protein
MRAGNGEAVNRPRRDAPQPNHAIRAARRQQRPVWAEGEGIHGGVIIVSIGKGYLNCILYT